MCMFVTLTVLLNEINMKNWNIASILKAYRPSYLECLLDDLTIICLCLWTSKNKKIVKTCCWNNLWTVIIAMVTFHVNKSWCVIFCWINQHFAIKTDREAETTTTRTWQSVGFISVVFNRTFLQLQWYEVKSSVW